MDAAKKSQTSDLLKNFTALKGIAPERFAEVLEKINIHDVAIGRYLFKLGDRDGVTFFLIKGVVELLDRDETVIGTITGGSDEADKALAQKQPRACSARVKKTATVASIGTNLLEVLTSNDSLSGFEVSAIDDQNDDDWMTLMLRSPVFQKLPPVNISRLITGMEPVSLSAGDKVFAEGDEGDCYYTVKSGRCKVSRLDAKGKETVLAELGTGDGFGEDALLSDAKRGATITMLTDGVLMTLAKSAFLQLLNQPLATDTSYSEALAFISGGAKWLDVRSVDEYKAGHIDGSLNIPYATLRDSVTSLVAGTSYIVCCNDGHLSNAAAFFLSQKGFDARVLTGGLKAVPAAAAKPDSGVVPIGKNTKTANASDATISEAAAGVPKQTYLKAVEARLNAEKELLKIKGAQTRIQEALHQETEARQHAAMEIAQLTDEVGELRKAQADARENTAVTAARIEQKSRESSGKLAAELDALRADLDVTRKALAETEQANKAQQTTIDSLQRELSGVTSASDDAVTQHRKEVEVLNQQLRALNDQLDATVREKDDTVSGQRRAEAELADLRRQLDTTAKGGEAMAAQIRQAEQSKRAAVDESETLRAELGALRKQMQQGSESRDKELAGLQQELATARDALAARTREVTDSAALASKRGSEIEQLRATAQSAARDTEAAKKEAALLRQELDNTRVHSSELERSVNELRESANKATNHVESASVELTRVNEELAKTHSDAAALREEAETLRRKLAVSEKLQSDTGELQDKLQRELNELRQQLESSTADRQQAVQQLAEERQAFEKALNDNRNGSARIEQEKRASEKKTEKLTQQIEALGEKLSVAERTHAAAIQAIEKERAQLDQHRSDAQSLADRHAARIEELEQQLKAAGSTQTARDKEIEQLRKQLHDKDTSTSAAAQTAEELQNAITDLRTQLAQIQEQRDTLQQDLRQANSELGTRQTQATETDARASEAENTVERLQSELNEINERFANAERESRERIELLERDLASAEAARQDSGRELADRIVHAEAEIAAKRSELADRESGADAVIAKIERESEYKLGKLTREIEELKKNLLLQTDKANSLTARDKEAAKKLAKYEKDLAQSEKRRDKLEAAVQKAKEIPNHPASNASARGGLATQIIGALILIGGSVAGTWFYLTNTGHESEATAPASIVPQRGEAALESGKPGAETADAAQPAAPKPLRTFRDRLGGGDNGPTMIELPGGTYAMGASNVSQYFDERPQHQVSLSRFAISKFEVTFDDYDRFADATGRRRPGDAGKGRGNRPVTNVTWHDATAYATWLSQQTGHKYRLPTESEWEYAARAGSTSFFWWGSDSNPVPANCFDCGGAWDRDGAFAVGSYKPNAFGLHDTASNAEEWVQDCYYENYDGAPANGSARVSPGCQERVARGGSFMTTLNELRSSKRSHYTPDTRDNRVGFRLARDR